MRVHAFVIVLYHTVGLLHTQYQSRYMLGNTDGALSLPFQVALNDSVAKQTSYVTAAIQTQICPSCTVVRLNDGCPTSIKLAAPALPQHQH